MRITFVILLFLTTLIALVNLSCESSVSYSPYLSRQSFEVQGKCEAFTGEDNLLHYDCKCDNSFRGAKGSFGTIYVEPPIGNACETRVYFNPGDKYVDITLYNILLPCFPDDALSEFLNSQTDGDDDTEPAEISEYANQFVAYITSATTLGSPLFAETIQLQIGISPQDLLQDTLCSYQLKARIESIPKGKYKFKLWNYNGEPVMFEVNGKLVNVIEFEI